MAKKSQGATKTAKPAAKKAPARPRVIAEKVEGETAVLAAIAEMPATDRVLAERLHAIVKATAPDLTARTWYVA
jgi:hypothetical protein